MISCIVVKFIMVNCGEFSKFWFHAIVPNSPQTMWISPHSPRIVWWKCLNCLFQPFCFIKSCIFRVSSNEYTWARVINPTTSLWHTHTLKMNPQNLFSISSLSRYKRQTISTEMYLDLFAPLQCASHANWHIVHRSTQSRNIGFVSGKDQKFDFTNASNMHNIIIYKSVRWYVANVWMRVWGMWLTLTSPPLGQLHGEHTLHTNRHMSFILDDES